MRWPIRNRPEQARARAEQQNARGLRLVSAGRMREALEAFQGAVSQAPSLLDARINLGSMLYRLAVTARDEHTTERLEEAARHFRYVLGLDSGHAAAALNLAATCNALGEHEESLRLLEGLARSHPQHTDVHYNLAVAYLHAGQPDKAREAALTELEHHGDHAQAARLLAELARED